MRTSVRRKKRFGSVRNTGRWEMDDRPTCDVIMKGGITSGVVYPPVVCGLARHYRLVNIGGASAGAIAAAAAAAAEYGQQHGGGGFAVLAGLPEKLGARPSGQTLLLGLFEPQRKTRPLMRVLGRCLTGGGLRRTAGVAGTALLLELVTATGWWRILACCLPGLAVVLAAVFATAVPWSVLLGVLGAVMFFVGLAVGTTWALTHRLLVEVPRNYLGIVNGSGSPNALTPWLTDLIDEAAGHTGGAPLTMADLWGAHDPETKRACLLDPGNRRINLEVMTTNLSEARPMRLPALSNEYFFKEAEFRALFPDRVVDLMKQADPIGGQDAESDLITRSAAAQGFLRLPRADLPVVVAARMSLSFPVLLSAVPLYKIDFSGAAAAEARDRWRARLRGPSVPTAEQAPDADDAVELPFRRCWISDGGITSNMPLHFFDTPLPQRPTFVVNLRPRQAGSPSSRVVLAENNQQGLSGVWTNVGEDDPTLAQFGSAILTTMQNWVDNAQMRMPGYRDRIVTVYLDAHEGGMNLDMDAPRITDLANYGHEAAGLLLQRFDDGDGWANQRWVRCRSFMAMLERLFGHLDEVWDTDPGAGLPSYRAMLDDPAVRPGGYPLTAGAQAWVRARADGLSGLAGAWPDPVANGTGAPSRGRFGYRSPRPRPEWRAQPRL
jgi:hypothetical protein